MCGKYNNCLSIVFALLSRRNKSIHGVYGGLGSLWVRVRINFLLTFFSLLHFRKWKQLWFALLWKLLNSVVVSVLDFWVRGQNPCLGRNLVWYFCPTCTQRKLSFDEHTNSILSVGNQTARERTGHLPHMPRLGKLNHSHFIQRWLWDCSSYESSFEMWHNVKWTDQD